MVVAYFWIFESILVTNLPPKSCGSRASLGLRRPRGAATSHPHSSTTTCWQKNGRRCPTSARGNRGNRSPGDGSLAPPPRAHNKRKNSTPTYHFFFRSSRGGGGCKDPIPPPLRHIISYANNPYLKSCIIKGQGWYYRADTQPPGHAAAA